MNQYVFKLPDLGEGVVEGEIVAWHVQPGDIVHEDDPLLDVMSDKATVTIPSAVSGRVVSISGNVGDMVMVGCDLVRLRIEANDRNDSPGIAAPHAFSNTSVTASMGNGNVSAEHHTGRSEPNHPAEKPLASPAVRQFARKESVDLGRIIGSGPEGRITHDDVESYVKSHRRSATGPPVSSQQHAGQTETPLTGLRRRIAAKMAYSTTHIPHFTYIEEVDVTELAALRHHLNEQRSPDDPKLTYLPLIMLATVRALRRHARLNAHFDPEREIVTQFEGVHLGIATQTERGLYVPVVRNVESMTLWQAARKLKEITEATHQNIVAREDLTGSTFTISSLGALGGLAATPIINSPEVAILGIHKAEDRPVVRDGEIVVRHMLNLSASFDHRVIDGVDAATFVRTVKQLLETPATLFI